MSFKCMKWATTLSIAILCSSLLVANARFDFYADDFLPQANGNSCQSQSIILALALEKHPAFQLNTVAEVREAEIEFRRLIEEIATQEDHLSASSHETWRLALEQYTSGHFKLNSELVSDRNKWASRVAEISGAEVSSDTVLSFLLGGVGKPVLTSVTAIETDNYSSGHIVTLLGIERRELVQSDDRHFIVAMNGAIKTPDENKTSCSASDLPGDYKYSAGVIGTDNYDLKGFGEPSEFLVMWLESK